MASDKLPYLWQILISGAKLQAKSGQSQSSKLAFLSFLFSDSELEMEQFSAAAV